MTCASCGMTVGWDCECNSEYNALLRESAMRPVNEGRTPREEIVETCPVCEKPIKEKSVKYDAWIHDHCAGEYIGNRGE